tara:strand:- start:11924 stop:12187 length:264 start_codon:yes stop_codon:yes gene_type:complete
MIKYQVLCWREIPAQVRVYGGKRPVSRQMPEWFQQEIDRTAMIEGLVGTDGYLQEWQWSSKKEWTGEDQDVTKVADILLKKLEKDYK